MVKRALLLGLILGGIRMLISYAKIETGYFMDVVIVLFFIMPYMIIYDMMNKSHVTTCLYLNFILCGASLLVFNFYKLIENQFLCDDFFMLKRMASDMYILCIALISGIATGLFFKFKQQRKVMTK